MAYRGKLRMNRKGPVWISASASRGLCERKPWIRTSVADMPGYPTRKLLFGGPETRTKADMVSHGDEVVGAGLGRQLALHGRGLGFGQQFLFQGRTASSRVGAPAAVRWCARSSLRAAAECGVGMQMSLGMLQRAGAVRQ